MMRWLIRLSIGAGVAALAIYLWSRMNQDYDDDEIEDEIPLEFDVPMGGTASTLEAPIEFDVPMDSAASMDVPAEAPSRNGDTGVGPGADLDQSAEAAASAHSAQQAQAAPGITSTAAPDTVSMASSDTTTQLAPAASTTSGDGGSGEYDDLTIIRGIGPVFQKRLHELGIMTFRQLADTKPEMLDAEGINGVGVDLESWIEQARELAEQQNT
jgi:predicted flap endonuclease-1-like 5' DNA nuclease/nitrogen fixation-related uncharacterized protein